MHSPISFLPFRSKNPEAQDKREIYSGFFNCDVSIAIVKTSLKQKQCKTAAY
jgi:hypothetical protein